MLTSFKERTKCSSEHDFCKIPTSTVWSTACKWTIGYLSTIGKTFNVSIHPVKETWKQFLSNQCSVKSQPPTCTSFHQISNQICTISKPGFTQTQSIQTWIDINLVTQIPILAITGVLLLKAAKRTLRKSQLKRNWFSLKKKVERKHRTMHLQANL